jgi:hypothetical protein
LTSLSSTLNRSTGKVPRRVPRGGNTTDDLDDAYRERKPAPTAIMRARRLAVCLHNSVRKEDLNG